MGKKLSIKPFGGIKTGSTKPNKYVDIDSTSGYYGIKGKYNLNDKTSISGSVSKDFYEGEAKFPGGSQKFKGEGKPYFELKIEKKFNKGGSIAIGCGKVMKDRKKKTKKY